MANETRVSATQLKLADAWLAMHGLGDAPATPTLAMRLSARHRARIAAQLLLGVLPIAAALAYVYDMTSALGWVAPRRRTALLILAAVVSGWVLARWLLDWWVRRVDRRAGAALARRAAHPVRLGWRTVLGWPHAAFAVAMYTAAAALTVGALTVRDAAVGDSTVQYAVVIVLLGMTGVAVAAAVQLHHVLAHPAVADDEVSLTADIIMRVEDARDVATPSVLWTLPIILLFGTALWWNVASLAFVVLGVVALAVVTMRAKPSAAVARQVVSAR
jgi:hypothetical protein